MGSHVLKNIFFQLNSNLPMIKYTYIKIIFYILTNVQTFVTDTPNKLHNIYNTRYTIYMCVCKNHVGISLITSSHHRQTLFWFLSHIIFTCFKHLIKKSYSMYSLCVMSFSHMIVFEIYPCHRVYQLLSNIPLYEYATIYLSIFFPVNRYQSCYQFLLL